MLPKTIDVDLAKEEFARLKTENIARNTNYFLLRQARQGNFRWPRDWPNHIPKVKQNLCKPIVERFSTYLMGKSFTFNVDRPNTLEMRDSAERTEKILHRVFDLSHADTQWVDAAAGGSLTGRTVFKAYVSGEGNRRHACFRNVQPDYFYGIPANDAASGEWAKVFFSYPVDRSEAIRLFGDKPYKTEHELANNNRYDPLPEETQTAGYVSSGRNRIPVLEVWTRSAYYLEVGGCEIFNGENPYKWSDSGEGFIPYVTIENIRNQGVSYGESDIDQVREINEQLNYLLSRKQYVVGRWLQPTLVWEGAPQNYLEILTSTIGGGGAIPTRLGSRLYFLAYDHANPAVAEMEATLRTSILETAGLNEASFQGSVHGYGNSTASIGAQFQPTTAVIVEKQTAWGVGLQKLCSMLLQLTEDIGDSEMLGLTVVNASIKKENASDGEVVQLSGQDIAGLRKVNITWPGILAKDDLPTANLEMQKMQAGVQSIYTTLEKLGEEFPDDEIARIRMENEDPSLKGQQVAEQLRAQGSNAQAMAQAAALGGGAGAPAPGGAPSGPGAPSEQDLAQSGNTGAKLRQLARNARPQLQSPPGGEPTIQSPPPGY